MWRKGTTVFPTPNGVGNGHDRVYVFSSGLTSIVPFPHTAPLSRSRESDLTAAWLVEPESLCPSCYDYVRNNLQVRLACVFWCVRACKSSNLHPNNLLVRCVCVFWCILVRGVFGVCVYSGVFWCVRACPRVHLEASIAVCVQKPLGAMPDELTLPTHTYVRARTRTHTPRSHSM